MKNTVFFLNYNTRFRIIEEEEVKNRRGSKKCRKYLPMIPGGQCSECKSPYGHHRPDV